MKTIQLQKLGMDNPLQIADTDIPKPHKGEVLIRTRAFSINPVDIKTRKGKGLYPHLRDQTPIILGWDISGEIVETGEDVQQFQPGDEVFGMVNFPGHGKAYAEYVAAPASHLAKKPANISHSEAAASTLAALTAYQNLSGNIQPDDKVFIHAAAGGVGHFAVQMANIMGAYSIGTASGKNEAFLASIGLDQFINYRENKFEELVSDVDFVLDAVGDDALSRSFEMVKAGGKIISIVTHDADAFKKLAEEKNVAFARTLVKSNGDHMQQIATWLEEEKLKASVFKEYALDEIEDAHRQVDSGTTRGKVVVVL